MHQPKPLSDVDIGFLKEAAANGYDVSFLTGYIDEFNDYQQKWAMIVDAAVEQHGPMVRVQLGQELAKLSEARGGCSIDDPRVQEIFNYIHKEAMAKCAANGLPDSGVAPGVEAVPELPPTPAPASTIPMEAATPRADAAAMPWTNPGGFKLDSSAGWGGGLGGILGLLLGQYLFKSPMLGALLGGLGGAGVGGMYGDKIKALLGGLFNKASAGETGPTSGDALAAGPASPPAKLSNGLVDPSSDVASRIPPNKSSPEGQVLQDSQNLHNHPDYHMEYSPADEPVAAATLPVEGTDETRPPTGLQMPAELADIEKQVIARGTPPTRPPGVAGQSINPIGPVSPPPNPFRGANGQVDPAAVKRTLGNMTVDQTVAAGQRSRMSDVGGRTDLNLEPGTSFAPGQIYGAQAAGKPVVPPQMKKGSVVDYWLTKKAYTSAAGNPLMPQQQPPSMSAPQPPQQQQNPAPSPLLPPGAVMGSNPASKVIMPSGYEMTTLGVDGGRTVGQQTPQPRPTNTTPQLDFNKQQHPLAV